MDLSSLLKLKEWWFLIGDANNSMRLEIAWAVRPVTIKMKKEYVNLSTLIVTRITLSTEHVHLVTRDLYRLKIRACLKLCSQTLLQSLIPIVIVLKVQNVLNVHLAISLMLMENANRLIQIVAYSMKLFDNAKAAIQALCLKTKIALLSLLEVF